MNESVLDKKPKGERPIPPPPSIADLKQQGVTGARLFCSSHDCGRYAVVPFEKIGKPGATLFPELRFRCSACGSRAVQAMPDWPKPGDAIPTTWGGR